MQVVPGAQRICSLMEQVVQLLHAPCILRTQAGCGTQGQWGSRASCARGALRKVAHGRRSPGVPES